MGGGGDSVEVRGLEGPALLAECGVLPGVGLPEERRGALAAAAVDVGAGRAVADADDASGGAASAGVVAATTEGHGGGQVVQALIPEKQTNKKMCYLKNGITD